MYEIENDLSCHYGLTGNSQDATGALNTNHNATDFCVFFLPYFIIERPIEIFVVNLGP